MISNSVTSLRILLLAPLYLLLVAPGGHAFGWWPLAVFLLAGLTDIADGFLARRLNEVSAAGAMLDLIADRLLTLTVVSGLVAGGVLDGWGALAGVVLIARDVIVSSLNEAQPGKLAIRVSPIERVKITLQFLGFGLLMAPPFWSPGPELSLHRLGVWALMLSAALALVTLGDYAVRAARSFRTS
jgi:CDP-diacylglycerol--glycerol-3-phosphate 3-phosphatidyltransferase